MAHAITYDVIYYRDSIPLRCYTIAIEKLSTSSLFQYEMSLKGGRVSTIK